MKIDVCGGRSNMNLHFQCCRARQGFQGSSAISESQLRPCSSVFCRQRMKQGSELDFEQPCCTLRRLQCHQGCHWPCCRLRFGSCTPPHLGQELPPLSLPMTPRTCLCHMRLSGPHGGKHSCHLFPSMRP